MDAEQSGLTTMTDSSVEDFGEHLILSRSGNGVILAEFDVTTEFLDQSHSLGLGDLFWVSGIFNHAQCRSDCHL